MARTFWFFLCIMDFPNRYWFAHFLLGVRKTRSWRASFHGFNHAYCKPKHQPNTTNLDTHCYIDTNPRYFCYRYSEYDLTGT